MALFTVTVSVTARYSYINIKWLPSEKLIGLYFSWMHIRKWKFINCSLCMISNIKKGSILSCNIALPI